MTAIADRLTQAFHAQRRGELPSAEETFLSILEDEPDNVNALQLLGLIYLKTGRIVEADERISRAIGLCPLVAELRNNRGLCRLVQGRLTESEIDFLEAIRLQPAYPEAFNNLGLATSRLGRHTDAEAAFIRAIRLQPNYPTAFSNLATTVLQQGRAANAEVCCRRALALRPGYPEAETTLGLVLEQLGRLDEAEACFRRSVATQALPLTWISLGRLLRNSGRVAEASQCFRAAIALAQNSIEGHHELGFTLLDLGKLNEAEAVARKALEIGPEVAEGHRLLGGVFRDQGHLKEAEACYLRSVELDQENAEAHRDLATLHLLIGRWKTGWKGYEWRWRCRNTPNVPFEQPPWDGSPLGDKTILLWSNQGLEDTLQFVRYTRLVKARGGRVILRAPTSLSSLFGSEYLKVDQVILEDQPLPMFDTHAPLTSLPGIFGTTPDMIPAEVPYLDHYTATWDFWQERLERFPGERVGIFWGSDRLGSGHHNRQVPPTAFAPLCSVPGISLISLQNGERSTNHQIKAVDLGSNCDAMTWVDMVAVVSGLDLVIGVDSTVVHLAGALGVPVWVALPFIPDWRWLLDGEESPWYPTMRLFRQPSLGDWDTVSKRLALELERWAHARASGIGRGRRHSGIEFTGAIYLENP